MNCGQTECAPIDVSTGDTVAFIEAHVASGAEILEVGCGPGHVASELASRGYRVTGFEADADQVALARRHGVSVVQAPWPSDVAARADAVVFTRSLHHISFAGHDVPPRRVRLSVCVRRLKKTPGRVPPLLR